MIGIARRWTLKKATEFQTLTIQGILKQCDVQFDAAQAFIEAHLPTGALPISNKVFDVERVAQLEEKFPEFGEKLMELLKPFYGWIPFLTCPDNTRIGRALKERYDECCGVVIIRLKEEQQIWSRKTADIGFSDSVKARFWSLKAIQDPVRTHAQTVASLSVCLANALLAQMLESRHGDVLLDQLACACEMIMNFGAAASEYGLFFRLWLEGNYPLGKDEGHHLLILVAD
jgi:hypothetical protein